MSYAKQNSVAYVVSFSLPNMKRKREDQTDSSNAFESFSAKNIKSDAIQLSSMFVTTTKEQSDAVSKTLSKLNTLIVKPKVQPKKIIQKDEVLHDEIAIDWNIKLDCRFISTTPFVWCSSLSPQIQTESLLQHILRQQKSVRKTAIIV